MAYKRRRRKNPSLGDISSLIQLGLLGGAAYVFYKYVWPLISGPAKKATDATTTALAKTIVALTSPVLGMSPQGSVVLSTGQEVPIASLTNVKPTTLPDGSAGATFAYGGQQWQFTGAADDNGTYYAIPAGAVAALPADFGINNPDWSSPT